MFQLLLHGECATVQPAEGRAFLRTGRGAGRFFGILDESADVISAGRGADWIAVVACDDEIDKAF